MKRKFTVYASTQMPQEIVDQLKAKRVPGTTGCDYRLYGLSNPKNGCIIFGELDGVIYKVTGQSKKDKDSGNWTTTWTSCEKITRAELNSLRSRFSK